MWEDPSITWTDSLTGSTVHYLNVTSLQWLNSSAYSIPETGFNAGGGDPSIWKHEVMVIVPPTVTITNTVVLYATGGCNSGSVTDPSDTEVKVVAAAAYEGQFVAAVMKQLPNCKMIFSDDPDKKPRSEDGLMSWTMKAFLNAKPKPKPELYGIFPMAKAALQGCRAVRDFAAMRGYITPDAGFIISGGSKRGQLTW